MSEVLENIVEELQLDRSDWKLTKFGDVTIQQKKKVDRENTLLTRYIKGEHMRSEDLHIREWGNLTDEYLGPAFIRKFEKGDILYGSRRTYLRKVAIADFDGITSNTTFVIKANEKKLDKRLLPFIMLSEGFAENSIKNSKGSVNPYVNWKDLAKYEFLLPPLDQQAELAELLCAMDEVIERETELKKKASIKYEVSKSNLVLKGLNNQITRSDKLKSDVAEHWKITTIGELIRNKFIIKVQDGNHGEIHPKSSDYIDDGIPFIMANTLINGKIDEVAIVSEKIKYPYVILTPQVTLYRTNNKKLKHKFLYYVFNSRYFQNQLLRLSSQSTRAYVGITSQKSLKIAIPYSIEEQNKIINVLSKVEKNLKAINSKISSSKALQKSLINQVF